jgi:formate hydrogenlyase transcriptional activator
VRKPAAQDKSFEARLIERSPDFIKVLDLDGRLLSVNAGGMAVLEICDIQPFIGSSWIDFWQGADRKAAQAAVKAAREGGIGRFAGFFSTVQTHKPMWFDVMVSPIIDGNGKPEKLLASSRDVTEWKRSDELLHAIIKGTSTVTGKEFFLSLVLNLAKGLGVRYSLATECITNNRVRSLAAWFNGKAEPDFEYDLDNSPCLKVMEGRTCHFERNLQKLFPEDSMLVDMRGESYLGVPLRDSTQTVIGHLVIMDDKPMAGDPLVLSVMETFAGRAGLELERMRAFENLHRQKLESEERFRDLFEEAPIAYVHESLDSRFIRANRAAMRILGLKPEEVAGTVGHSLVPDTPDAQSRLREMLASLGSGTETARGVLELRRKDDGKPVWLQVWSKPDPSGTYTRTMFLDITDRVLMEQEHARLQAQNAYLQEEIRVEHNFTEIVGNSAVLRDVLRQVDQAAPTDSTVLILGETGTGKELIARALHDRSSRKNCPLVKVNCGAISAGLVESELFGHVKGAFTGALANRDGRFKLADGGTIFLDEVGELPPDTQLKLLRVLQEQEFEPIGSGKTVKVNVRVIAATNRDLSVAMREGKFRSDLFYRLNVLPMRVPSLRERVNDIPLLTTFFLQRFAKEFNKPLKQISDETIRRLCAYPWPGNIRELQNIIERAVVLSTGNALTLAPDFNPAVTTSALVAHAASTEALSATTISAATPPPPCGALEDVERRHIESVLGQADWMIEGKQGAAKILNMTPSTLRSRMQKLGIKRPGKTA